MTHTICLKYPKYGKMPKGSLSHTSQLWITSQGIKYFYMYRRNHYPYFTDEQTMKLSN